MISRTQISGALLLTGYLFAYTGAQPVTLESFLARLRESHPLISKERLQTDVEKRSQQALQGAEDWMIRSQVGFSHEEPALSFSGPERTNSLFLEAHADRALWSTGGRVSASFSSGAAGILPRFGFSMPLYQHSIDISYVHPLLRNTGGSLDRLAFDLKQFDIDVSDLSASERIEVFLSESARLFLSWALLGEQERIVAERLRLSTEERDRMADKRRANLVDQADVIRAEDAVRSWTQQQVLVHSQFKALAAQLAVMSDDASLAERQPEINLYELPDLPSLEESVALFRHNSRILRSIDARSGQSLRSRDGHRELLQPDVSAYVRVGTKRLHERFGTSLVLNRPDADIGLRMSLPLGNTTATAEIARSDVQIEQLQRTRESVERDLLAQITNLHIRLADLRQVLTLNQEQITSAQKRTTEELSLYNQGRGDLTFVILSRDNEQNARLLYAQNAWSYHALFVEFRALLDTLYPDGGQ